MAYTKTNWQNEPSKQTPVSAENLNHMEQGIYDANAKADSNEAKLDALQARETVSTAAQMTDHSIGYIYTGSEAGWNFGHWYYWENNAWQDGGAYNAIAVNTDKRLEVENAPADGKATGDAISSLKSTLIHLEDDVLDIPQILEGKANPYNVNAWTAILENISLTSGHTYIFKFTPETTTYSGAINYRIDTSAEGTPESTLIKQGNIESGIVYSFTPTENYSGVRMRIYGASSNVLIDASFEEYKENIIEQTQGYFSAQIDKIEKQTKDIHSPSNTNIFDRYNITRGLLNVDGTITENDTYICTDYISVKAGETVCFYQHTTGTSISPVYLPVVAAYDYKKRAVASKGQSANASSYKVPNGICFIRVACYYGSGYSSYEAYMFSKGESTTWSVYKANNTFGVDFLTEETAKKIDERVNETKAIGLYSQQGTEYNFGLGGEVYTNYVASESELRIKKDANSLDIVAFNHDDFQAPDYTGTWKVYSKYGYNANFSYILKPFSSVSAMQSFIDNAREMVLNGNDIGLHSIFNETAWIKQKLYDVKPNETFTYAPTLSEQTTVVSGGANVFGYTVADSYLKNIGFIDPPSDLSSVLVTNLTSAQYVDVIKNYSLYYMTTTMFTGLDLTNTEQTWSILYWLEYWYNELIDNTLGYSSTSNTTLQRYVDDYEVPSGTAESGDAYAAYYPDAEHLANGKIVFFDDTDNDHYSDPSYQKVGRFSKGLFKGHATCLNYEVVSACIDIARVFLKHYLDYDKLTAFDYHGVRYVSQFWYSDNIGYDDRNHTILAGECGRFFDTKLMAYMTERDIFISRGIRMTFHLDYSSPKIEGMLGLYYGQKDSRYPFFSATTGVTGMVNYLTLLGNDSSSPVVPLSLEEMNKYIQGKENLLKFVYENADSTLSNSEDEGTKYLFPYVKNIIDDIRGLRGTGIVPSFSVDTISYNASNMAALELVLRYCYENNITVVPFETARVLASTHDRWYKTNYMPNPNFTQSLLNVFGGSSTSHDAYLPDGWIKGFKPSTDAEFMVSSESVDNKTRRTLKAVPALNGNVNIMSRIAGIPSGKYNFSVYAKGSGTIKLYIKHNGDFIDNYKYSVLPDETITPTGEWTKYTVNFDIPEPYQSIIDHSDAKSQCCLGYEQNVANITIELDCNDRVGIAIAEPKISLTAD